MMEFVTKQFAYDRNTNVCISTILMVGDQGQNGTDFEAIDLYD